MTPEATAKTVQYLSEAHATELALTRTLQAHVAMTPRGSYRGLLERHLQETKAQASALEDRLSELGEGRSLFEATWEAALTLGQGVLGQALALSKGPLDLLRGSGGEEKMLKNAKDECSTEALEIATYDALEQLATRTGDESTAELARRHRTQEERMLAGLRELIPGLVDDVVRAELEGVPVYDASETPAGERASAVAQEARDAARDVTSGARDVASGARRTAREVGEDVTSTARESVSGTVDATRRVGDTAAGAASEIADEVREGAADVTANVQTGTQKARQDAAKGGRRAAARTRQAGRAARTDAREAVDAATDARGEPWNGYDGQSASEVVRRLGRAPQGQVESVREYERGHKDRVSVLRAAERQLSGS